MAELKKKKGDNGKLAAARKGAARHRKEKGIYRHDYSNTHGYRAYIKFKGQEYQKIFSDKGNPAKALAQARRWRKLKLQTLQASALADNPLKKMYANNKSGVTGVFRSDNNWQAAWVEKGLHRNRKFSIEAYGDKAAFRCACRERALAEQRLYGEVAQATLQHYV
ncbi:MAG: hypothetical protein ACJ74W_08195 [Pyrinomonadaceae bacterium]